MPLHNDVVLQVGSSSSTGAMACCWLCKCWLSHDVNLFFSSQCCTQAKPLASLSQSMLPLLWPTLNSDFPQNFWSQPQKPLNMLSWFWLHRSYFWVALIVVDADSASSQLRLDIWIQRELSTPCVISEQFDVLSRVCFFLQHPWHSGCARGNWGWFKRRKKGPEHHTALLRNAKVWQVQSTELIKQIVTETLCKYFPSGLQWFDHFGALIVVSAVGIGANFGLCECFGRQQGIKVVTVLMTSRQANDLWKEYLLERGKKASAINWFFMSPW